MTTTPSLSTAVASYLRERPDLVVQACLDPGEAVKRTGKVNSYCCEMISLVRHRLEKARSLQGKELAIVVQGSDARFEKASIRASPFDVTLIYRGEFTEETKLDVEKDLKSLMSPFEISSETQWVSLDEDKVLTHSYGRCFLYGYLHLRTLFGNDDYRKKMQSNFLSQVRALSPKDVKTCHKMNTSKSISKVRKIAERQPIESLDALNGRLLYAHDKGRYLRGTKYSILRAIQYSLDHSVIKHIRSLDSIRDAEAFLEEMPDSVVDLIDWLCSRRVLKLTDTGRELLKRIYQQALVTYSISQLIVEGIQDDYSLVHPEVSRFQEICSELKGVLSQINS